MELLLRIDLGIYSLIFFSALVGINFTFSRGAAAAFPCFSLVITVFRHDLVDHKNKYGVATDLFLYRCDRSPGVHVLKLGIEIPNLKQHNWSTKIVLRILKSGSSVTCEKGLAPSRRPFENGTKWAYVIF